MWSRLWPPPLTYSQIYYIFRIAYLTSASPEDWEPWEARLFFSIVTGAQVHRWHSNSWRTEWLKGKKGKIISRVRYPLGRGLKAPFAEEVKEGNAAGSLALTSQGRPGSQPEPRQASLGLWLGSRLGCFVSTEWLNPSRLYTPGCWWQIAKAPHARQLVLENGAN